MKKLKEVVPFETADGSMTLFDQERGIHYRSHHGAISESRHVFLGATGLLEEKGEWRVAELGFGAAVNFTQTVAAFREGPQVERLIYHTVDWRTVTADHLNFHQGEGGALARELARQIHEEPGSVAEVSSDDGAIRACLHPGGWEEVEVEAIEAQAFFHDPFSIRVNPEAWQKETFEWARRWMMERGRLATYSAASAVKRAMFEARFFVATAPGPGRKREMTIASPSEEVLRAMERGRLLERSRYLGEENQKG